MPTYTPLEVSGTDLVAEVAVDDVVILFSPTLGVRRFDAGVLDLSADGLSLVKAADYAAMKALLNLEIGTDIPPLPSGTPDGSKFLRDDNTWQAVAVDSLDERDIWMFG